MAALCECGQATISELDRGKNKNPSFKLGQALIALDKASDKEIEQLLARLAEPKAA
jgi:hypothetical protein